MEIVDFIAAKFDGELVARFRELASKEKIPLDLFRDEPNQEVLARYLMGEIATMLASRSKPEGTWMDISIYSYMLHILGAESSGELIETYKNSKNALPSVGASSAVAVPLSDID